MQGTEPIPDKSGVGPPPPIPGKSGAGAGAGGGGSVPGPDSDARASGISFGVDLPGTALDAQPGVGLVVQETGFLVSPFPRFFREIGGFPDSR
jgi:hypothetical protein